MLTVFFKALPVFLKTTSTLESFFSDNATLCFLKAVDECRTRAVVRAGVEILRAVEALTIVASV